MHSGGVIIVAVTKYFYIPAKKFGVSKSNQAVHNLSIMS